MAKLLASVISKAAKEEAGVNQRGRVEAGERTDRTATDGAHYTVDQRYWHDVDAPGYIGDLSDTLKLKPEMWANGAIMDLYVYDGEGELITNVCAVVSADQELLACYDSVTLRGIEWSQWWLEGTECRCILCAALEPLP